MDQFSRDFDYFYSFAGLAPDKGITKDQLDEFSKQISKLFKTDFAKYEDWSDAFQGISERIKDGKVLLFFDEISWMAMNDHIFLAKIKNFWNFHLNKIDSSTISEVKTKIKSLYYPKGFIYQASTDPCQWVK